MFYHFDAPKKSGFLLDKVKNAAAAYSLRKLKSTATRAIRVRRSVDNAEQDFGFDARGELDAATLLGFVNGGDGYVTTWYDQSGNGNHATQATIASQPRIVNSGMLDLQNGKPALVFSGAQNLATPAAWAVSIPKSIFTIFKNASLSSEQCLFDKGGGYAATINGTSTNQAMLKWYANNSQSYTNAMNVGNLNVLDIIHGGTSATAYVNGMSIGTNGGYNNSIVSDSNFVIGSNANNAMWLNGSMMELILYTDTLSDANRTAIESDQMKYFNISGM